MSYQLLHDVEKEQHEDRLTGKRLPLTQNTARDWIVIVFCLAICSTLSFYLGSRMSEAPQQELLASDGRLAPSGNVETAWTYNYTFSQEPNLVSEAAWASLPPVGGAFVKNPASGSGELNVAAYHQLHCLHGIRIAFYFELAKSNETLREIMSEARPDWGDHNPEHTIHCFDYLRQAIECAADSNLEPLNAAIGHVDAWGTKRICRNKAFLDEWAYKWRSSNRTGIVNATDRGS